MNEAIDDRLARIFAQVLPLPGGIEARRASLDSVDGWDSVVHINLILAVEQEFRIVMTPEEASNALSFAAMHDLVAGKLGPG